MTSYELKPSASVNHATRRLQTVLMIDKKDQKNLKVREMACADIEAVASSLNVNLQVFYFYFYIIFFKLIIILVN